MPLNQITYLWSVEYAFIDISSRSILTQSNITSKDQIGVEICLKKIFSFDWSICAVKKKEKLKQIHKKCKYEYWMNVFL